MKFGKRYSNVTVIMAMLHGVILGIAAIAIVGFILIGTNGKDKTISDEVEVPAAGPASTEKDAAPPTAEIDSIQMFAKQHGAFSSAEAAATFVASDPSLSTSAIIQTNNQYFVWSAVGLSEVEITSSLDEGSFKKAFTANTSSCEAVSGEKMRDVLVAQNLNEIQILDNEKEDEKIAEFNRNITSITSFTKDLKVIRLHILAHYSHKVDCIKISF